ncbi:hypothetical protein E5675_09560 [Sphingopyxis sp. PAMC25046]|uniref:hypothetical protein n=1 Tax=Sphingopyxis sp. PAMC25046 TaxID=2565556 RepID=UPI00109DBBAA|nr:hypothetical protein [Sphingopyxis sp. PAMC25046]QCB54656.1 hypothetical protein E5675_09560 [Sphingopyxis sp. PAMC25046]
MDTKKTEHSNLDGGDPASPWSGFAEVSEAIRDNRLMEYRIKKSWADPWGQKLTVAGLAVILGVFLFLAGASFGFW